MRSITRFTTRALLTLGILLLAAGGARAGGGPHGHRHGPPLGAMLDFHAEALGLDEAQREAIREIVESSHERGEALRDEVRAERRALFELMDAEPVDREAIMAQVDRVAEREAEAERHRIDALLRIREQLTPEQRAALVELREGMRERHLRIGEQCDADLAEHCPEGGVPCLFRNRDALSEPCSEALDAFPGHAGHGRWKHRHAWGPDAPDPGSE